MIKVKKEVIVCVLVVFTLIIINLNSVKQNDNEKYVKENIEVKEENLIKEEKITETIEEKKPLLKTVSKKDITAKLLNINQEKGFASESIEVLQGVDTVSFCDDFNRPFSTDLGTNWDEVVGDMFLTGDGFVDLNMAGVRNIASLVNPAFLVVQDSTQKINCRLDQFEDSCGLVSRYKDESNYYLLKYSNDLGSFSLELKKVIANVTFPLTDPIFVSSGADEISLMTNGDILSVYSNGVLKTTATDNELQGVSSIGIYGDQKGTMEIDNYKVINSPVLDFYCNVCGNGVLESPPEECDQGIDNGDNTACKLNCNWNSCGDGFICNDISSCGILGDTVLEVCDGNSQSCTTVDGYFGTQTCLATCDGFNGCTTIEYCGDGIINGNEACDDGVNNGQLGFCNPSCTGIVQCLSDLDCSDNNVCNGVESCDLNIWTCVTGTPLNCDDGLFCNGVESCDSALGCQAGAVVDCSVNNIDSIATCDYVPDNIATTWDSFLGFTSSCDENTDSCTIGTITLTHSCSISQCGAQCETNLDCGNYCFGDVYNYNGLCQGDCSCSYTSEDCNLNDGWYDTGGLQWVNMDQCNEKEQKEQGYREYTCGVAGCEYSVIQEQWIDTGNIRAKVDGISCDDALFCTVNDICTTGVCVGSVNSCDDSVLCTVDSCNEEIDQCENLAINSLCDDGLFCNGEENCNAMLGCQIGVPPNLDDGVACTIDSCDEINQIQHNPDNNLCSDNEICTNDICDIITGCSNIPIDNDLDTYSICPGINFDCDDNNMNINPGASEICTDGFDNNCNNECDYDTSLPCTLHGDVACPVEISSISASDTDPFENTNIEVRCNANVANVNSVQAYLDATSCIFDRWENNDAIFICNVGPVGMKTAKCTVDLSKSYQLGTDKTMQINVRSSVCGDYNTEIECPNSICEWCVSCQGTMSSGISQDTCVNLGTCSYVCIVDSCGAACDANVGCSATDCDYLDGCVGRDYYDYSDVSNTCLTDCSCESNSCISPVINYEDPYCISLTTTTTLPETTTTAETSTTTEETSTTTAETTTSSLTSSTTFGTAETTTSSSTTSTTVGSQPPSGGGGGGGGRRIESGIRYACNDGEDNDKDGYCDLKDSSCIDGSMPGDPGCYSIFDDNETNFIPPPYLKPPEMCKVCYGKNDLSNLNVLSEFFNYQNYFNDVYGANNVECCECNRNNKQDIGEEGVDCGGVCPSCEVKLFIWPECKIDLWLIIITLVLLILQFLFKKLNKVSVSLVGTYVLSYISLHEVALKCNLLNLIGLIIILQQLYVLSRKREISFL